MLNVGLFLLTAFLGRASAAGVTGAAEGFAKGVTGGGSASPVYPSTNAELVSYLGDSSARVIILTKTFDFTGTEGTTSATGCAPYGTASGCQTAINQNNWCTEYQPNAPSVSVKYDNAAITPITVKSNKSLVGSGSSGILKGKGLKMVSGASNIIIQNVHITNLNPQYVWGGDAITLNGADLVWIDHVKTSLIGRQHIVLGYEASNRVTISNNEIDGSTSWSATVSSFWTSSSPVKNKDTPFSACITNTSGAAGLRQAMPTLWAPSAALCDGHHYWGLYFTGSNDLITLKGNYIHHTSGRSPKVGGNTLLHAVNNYWYANSGHAFEMDSGSMAVVEGNVFQNVVNEVEASSFKGKMFNSPDTNTNAACASYLGHNCQLNAFGSSTGYSAKDTSFFSNFQGKNIASASTASSAQSSVPNSAGFGKI